MKKQIYPLEVTVKIALESTKLISKGDVLSFSPDGNSHEFQNFLTGKVNGRRLALFTSGAYVVHYDPDVVYLRALDEAYFESEHNIAVRSLTYRLRNK